MRAEKAWKEAGDHLTFGRRDEARKKMRETLFYMFELQRIVEREEITEEHIRELQAQFGRVLTT